MTAAEILAQEVLICNILWECPSMIGWTNSVSPSKNRIVVENSLHFLISLHEFCAPAIVGGLCVNVASWVFAAVLLPWQPSLSSHCFPLTSHSSVNSLFQDKLFAVWAEAASRLFLCPKRPGHLAPCFIPSWLLSYHRCQLFLWHWILGSPLFPQRFDLYFLSKRFAFSSNESYR